MPPEHLFELVLLPSAAPIFEAWNELSTSRPAAPPWIDAKLPPPPMNAIPFMAIDTYAARYGIADLDAFDAFRRMIRALDAFFIAWKP